MSEHMDDTHIARILAEHDESHSALRQYRDAQIVDMLREWMQPEQVQRIRISACLPAQPHTQVQP